MSLLGVRVVGRRLHGNRGTVLGFFSGERLRDVALCVLGFVPASWLVKVFPMWCGVKVSFFSMQ